MLRRLDKAYIREIYTHNSESAKEHTDSCIEVCEGWFHLVLSSVFAKQMSNIQWLTEFVTQLFILKLVFVKIRLFG